MVIAKKRGGERTPTPPLRKEVNIDEKKTNGGKGTTKGTTFFFGGCKWEGNKFQTGLCTKGTF